MSEGIGTRYAAIRRSALNRRTSATTNRPVLPSDLRPPPRLQSRQVAPRRPAQPLVRPEHDRGIERHHLVDRGLVLVHRRVWACGHTAPRSQHEPVHARREIFRPQRRRVCDPHPAGDGERVDVPPHAADAEEERGARELVPHPLVVQDIPPARLPSAPHAVDARYRRPRRVRGMPKRAPRPSSRGSPSEHRSRAWRTSRIGRVRKRRRGRG